MTKLGDIGATGFKSYIGNGLPVGINYSEADLVALIYHRIRSLIRAEDLEIGAL